MSGPFGSVDARAFRKRRNLWLAYASELAAPVLRAGASLATRNGAFPPSQWRNGLIIGHNHIGDVLYRTASLDRLHAALPGCRWTYLTSRGSASILANNPAIDEVLPLCTGDDSWRLESGGFRALGARVFDVALCTNTLRHYPDLTLAAALGIPNRVGFVNKGLSGLINHPVRFDFPSSYPAYFRTMVAAVTASAPTWSLRPRILPGDAADVEAERVWREAGLDGASAVLACSLTTRQAVGNWPRGVLLSILSRAREFRKFKVVLCGAPEDKATIAETARQLEFPVAVVAGRLSLPGFAAFLAKCSALLTLDSGPRHIGNAAGIPVIFTRNLSHSRIEAGQYCDTELDLAPDAEYLTDVDAVRAARGVDVDRAARSVADQITRGAVRVSSPRSS
ncbi:MAG: glycosyltransferase family 9 protein [Gemmatimonadaceae bacterium]|nr:glycosyltransferase family 9 protein [Gemmatimonadaceae bacterium]